MSMIGKTLGNFTLEAEIGKGGMGEVYKAKDQKLGRDVAIKVLPEEFATDAERVARFQREAKLLASLNHPNIAAIHGLEESDGTHFLVLELIEGDTLADRLKRGAIPVEESLKLALQIAEALEAAHEKGVIHRDMKPANIKVTPDEKVKVLDFGLAKAFAGEQAEVNLSHSPTLSEAATLQGVILGTAAYMSPEQARGKFVDKRTDIWAFGCVLYEMLTGKAAFQGEDVTEILAAVVKSGVNLDLLPANIHPRAGEVITRCLQKDQKKRYRDIGDVQYEIEKVLTDPGGVLVQPTAGGEAKTKLRQMLPWIAAAVIAAAIITGVAVWHLKRPPSAEPKRVMRFDYELPEGLQFNRDTDGAVQYQFAISPDGSQFVLSTTEGLHLRSMNTQDARHIAGTDEDSVQPFFSPDGQWIGYLSRTQNKLMKVAISGGAPIVLCDASGLYTTPSWDSEDTILYSDAARGIMRVSANGGTPEVLVKGSAANLTKEAFPIAPQMLPDGKTLLFINMVGDIDFNNYHIVAQSLKSGERKILIRGGEDARYISTGHLLYRVEDSLIAVPFDLDKLEVTGEPVLVPEDIGNYDVSDSGTMIYIPQSVIEAATWSHTIPVWVDRKGKEEPLAIEPNLYMFCKISPDGTQAAFTAGPWTSNVNVWIYDLKSELTRRLTFDEGFKIPLWTADSKRIIYFSIAAGSIFMKRTDGTGEVERLGSKLELPHILYPFSRSNDGNAIVLGEVSLSPFQADIAMMSMEGDNAIRPLLHDNSNENYPQISPYGQWMAYQSDATGRYEVWVCSFPDVNQGRWQVTTGGGDSPLWSPDGRELFYRSGDSYMAVDVQTGPTFKFGKPEILFKGAYVSNSNPHNYVFWDISPDGKRFLMIKLPEESAPPASAAQPKITIVVNWFEELKERVPVD